MSTDAPAAHRCSVLIVDPDDDVRDVLRVALGGDGYDTAAAENGRAALDYLRSHADVCMILLEPKLPVMDGAQFRAMQRRDRALAWIPVIVMSPGLEGDRQARELGARSFVRKPLDVDEVRAALRQIGCCQAKPRSRERLSLPQS